MTTEPFLMNDTTCEMPSIKRGFTLVETLVAILVLSFILVSVTALLTRTMRATTISQDSEIAAKLAQEGLELVRAKRNRNLVDETVPYDHNLSGQIWKLDSTQLNALQVGGEFLRVGQGSEYLCRRTAPATLAGKYSYDCPPGESVPLPGNFQRTVRVTSVTPYSMVVVSTVTWSGGQVQVGTMLYDYM